MATNTKLKRDTLRNDDNYLVPRYKLSVYEKSFLPDTVKKLNNDLSIRNSENLNIFKSKIQQ